MPLRQTIFARIFAALGCLVLAASSASAAITDFNSWTKVGDPSHAGLEGVVNSVSVVTLSATGAIPSAYDVGFQSVDGASVSSAATGHYFSASDDFTIAVDFALSSLESKGAGGIGFGIGEDGAGANSAGVGVGFLDGTPLAVSGAARVNDANQPFVLLDGAAVTDSGRLFIEYRSLSGDLVFGISATQGSAAPDYFDTLAGIQNLWNEEDLLVSIFLRSEQVSIFPALSAGTVEAVFSDFSVLEGMPRIAAVPLPAAFWLMGTALVGLGLIRRR